MNPYERAAAKYQPAHTSVLFIAESPPSSVDRYFYFEHVSSQDSLWVELMKAIYSRDFGETSTERRRKAEWLARFQNDGCQLIDAFKEPFSSDQSPRERTERIRSKSNLLIDEVKAINPDQIVLIKATVFEALSGALRAARLPVVNIESLPFPGSGQQRKFRNGIEQLRASGKLTIPRRLQK